MDDNTHPWTVLGYVLSSIGALILMLILLKYYLQGNRYKKNNRIDGKVAIVTGSNSGLGKETALELAKRGAKVYLACRDMQRCEAARQEIINQSNNPNVFARRLDLASLESVREFVKNFQEEEQQLDILVNNAGMGGGRKKTTVDGYEMMFAVNHLGHFLLTNLLLDLLKKSAPSRIVVVSSITHNWGEINKDNLMGEKQYDPRKAYCNSKLANVMFTRHLSKMLDGGSGVTVNTLHPGFVQTEIFRHSGPFKLIIKPLILFFSKSAKNGAQTQIKLALDPDLENVSGKYFDNCKVKEVAQRAKNDKKAAWLWEQSAQMTNIEG